MTRPSMLLRRGDTLLGSITDREWDMFWLHARFEPTPEFEAIRSIFVAWSRAVSEANETTIPAAYRALKALELVIDPNDGSEPITDFWLYIDGDRARLRILRPPAERG